MGCDVSILSNHKLNITNVESLAIDLAKRLNININFGYYSNEELSKLLGINISDGFIKLGSVIRNDSNKIYLLIDGNFQRKQLYKKFGEQLFEMKEYWLWIMNEMPSEDRVLEEKKDIFLVDYYLDCVEESGAKGYMYIYDEIIVNDLYYYTRWWDFCKTIHEVNDNDYIHSKYFKEFRELIKYSTIALGGNKAYFVNDECIHLKGVGQGDEIDYKWKELEEFINSREILEVFSISKASVDKNYQVDISKKDIRNLAFYDDFSDICS